ncbi:MAG TPA: ComF family protein [Candidatus Competibacter sp.]|nr:ComF family protein [Candidatus Competibacter sp.]
MIGTWFGAIQDNLLPPICLLCGADGMDGRDLCAGCAASLPRNALACPGCATPTTTGQIELCPTCRARPLPFDCAFVPFHYRPPIDFLVCGLKFDGRLSHARLLGELLADALAERGGSLPDRIVPVPLHPRRLRERGFNQALELARATARRFRIPLAANGLRRARYTTPQIQLDARRRRTNLLGAFVAGHPLHGARIALVDDVITTAGTVAECARALRAAGATDIEVWAIARAADF